MEVCILNFAVKGHPADNRVLIKKFNGTGMTCDYVLSKGQQELWAIINLFCWSMATI